MRLTWKRHLAPNEPPAGSPLRAQSPHVAIGRTSAVEPRVKVPRPSDRTGKWVRAEEWDQLNLELTQAKGRVSELTRSQVELTSTIARLTELASTDVLTGLNNRRRFNEALEANFTLAIKQKSTLSVIMLDVDFFKSFNDTFGHSVGDTVLCVVAEQLLRSCSNYHVVARYGGEEFAILLPAADSTQAREYAELQRVAIESYLWPLRRVTASFGVATLKPSTVNPTDLVEEADKALYHSKSQGRNRVTHHLSLELVRPSPAVTCDLRPVSNLDVHVTLKPGHAPDPIAVSRGSQTLEAALSTETISHRPPQESTTTDHSRIEAPSDALNRFLKQLRDGRKAPHQYRTALLAIHEGLEAGLVFLCSEQGDHVLESVGDNAPTPQWCHRVIQKLSAELPRGGLWKKGDGVRPLPEGPDPYTAVVFAVESPRPSWLVALRFDGGEPFVSSDLRLVRLIWQLQADKKSHAHVYDNLKETLFGMIRCLSTAIDAKDPYTCGHSERVARIAVRLGKQMKLSSGEVSDLYLAGLLHDVGKIGIRDEVLCKPGPLTPAEFIHIQEHPVIGERIIANVTRLAYLRPGVRGHHERFDGKGYPDGLSGEAIPLMARILAVADSCDAMMSARRYRPELSRAKIEDVFKDGAGTQWDPRIVECFFDCRDDLYAVFQRGLGQSVYMAVERAAGGDDQEGRVVRSLNHMIPALEASL
jgi:diguanylate cyclase (GGDEF)-like protein